MLERLQSTALLHTLNVCHITDSYNEQFVVLVCCLVSYHIFTSLTCVVVIKVGYFLTLFYNTYCGMKIHRVGVI